MAHRHAVRTLGGLLGFPCRRLSQSATGGREHQGLDSCLCLSTRVPPGVGTTSGLHIHPSDQLYYVLRGTMHARVGDATHVVEPGDLVIIPAARRTLELERRFGGRAALRAHRANAAGGYATGDAHRRQSNSKVTASAAGFEVVRPVDESRFDPQRFSQVVLADRSSGLNTLSLGVFHVPSPERSTGAPHAPLRPRSIT